MSTTITVYLHDEPSFKGMHREYKASIKKEGKTYWLVDVDGYSTPWKFSKSDRRRVKPDYDQRNFELLIHTVRHVGTIDTLLKEARENHASSLESHEYYTGRLLALAAGVYACFGRHHIEYDRILECQQHLVSEWREIVAERKSI